MKRNRLRFLTALPPTFGLIALLIWSAGSVQAQGTVIFEATSDRKEVPLGERFQVTFTLRNSEGTGFKPPDFQGFKLVGPTEKLTGSVILNGRSSVYQSWVYELEALRQGVLVIAPASVTAGGKVLRSEPLSIRVGPAQSVNVPRGKNQDLFITAECYPAGEVFVGQQVKFQVKVYTRLAIDAVDLLEIPKFEGFHTRELKRFDTRVREKVLRGKPYAVRTLLEIALFPQEAGTMTISPVRMRLEAMEPGAPSSIFRPATKPVLLQTAPVTLQVKPLPDPPPASFSGVAGQYVARFSADRDSLTTDDAFTLVVEIEGDGNARDLLPPRLTLPDGLETFDPKVREEEEYETTEKIMHRQVLEYVILPKKPGQYTLTPEFAYFDADSNRYVSRRSEQPLLFTVAPGQNAASGLVPDSTGTGLPSIRTEADWRLRLAEWSRLSWFWWALAVPAGLLVLFLLFRKKRRRVVTIPAPQPPVAVFRPLPGDPRTTREYFTNARRLLSNDSPRLFYDELYKALRAWLAARLGAPVHLLTPEFVRVRLAERGAPEARIAQLLEVWETCEQAIFAGRHPYLNMDTTWRQAEETVQALDRDLRH